MTLPANRTEPPPDSEGHPPLSPGEIRQMAALEATIREGIPSFVAVGNALAEIRDKKHFAPFYPTFADYLMARWGLLPRASDRLIQAGDAVNGIEGPTNTTH